MLDLKLLTNYQQRLDQRKYKINSKDLDGGTIDIHQAIGKLPKQKAGRTLPGHRYAGPYNDLENQVRCNPETGEILEIYDAPTGKTDAVAMQYDVDYSVCGDNKKCKHKADRKTVKSFDAIPYNERQWRHCLARNLINTSNRGLQTDKTGQHLNGHRGQHSLLRTRTTQQPRKCFNPNQASENVFTQTK